MYVYVENDQIKEVHYSLPTNWKNTSGFYHIGDDRDELYKHGFYIVDKQIPDYNPDDYTLSEPTLTFSSNTVTATYSLIEKYKKTALEMQEDFFNYLRGHRDEKLKQSDWAVAVDLIEVKGESWKVMWSNYRQSLRNLPALYTFAPDEYPIDVNSILWPQEPPKS